MGQISEGSKRVPETEDHRGGGGRCPSVHGIAWEALFEKTGFKLKPAALESRAGWRSPPGRDRRPLRGPGVGKTRGGEGRGGACRGGACGGESRSPSRAHPAGRRGNPSLRPASRRASRRGSGNGSPVRAGGPGLGRQDVERVCFLFVLEVCFPANTCLAALPLSRGSQGQHSIAHERP